MTTGPLAHVFVPAYSTLNREIKINQPFTAILAWQKRRKVYFFVGILKGLGYSGHRFSSKENNENMREIATNQNILSYTKKSQKPDPESVFFIVPIRQKSLKEIPKALNFGVVLLIRLRSIYYLQEELSYRFSLRKRLDRI